MGVRYKIAIFFILFSILIAGALPYISSLNNPFIWDEEVTIVGNPIIKNLEYLPFIFKLNIFGSALSAGSFYRPIYTLSFMLDYHIWKLNPFGYHVFNIAFHILNALLLYYLILKIGLDRKIAWVSSLLFVLSPVNTQAVTLIGGRVELILGFLSLLFFITFLDGLENRIPQLFLSVLVFIPAIFTKESSLVLPFILLSYILIFSGRGKRKKPLFLLSGFFAIALIYGIFRFIFLGGSIHRTLSLINEASFMERLYTLPRILLTYIRLIVLPSILKGEYHFVVHSAKDIYVWLGVPFLISMFIFIYKFLREKRYFVFFLCWFLIAIFPYSNIFIPLHATLMEHWAYFASMAFSVIMSMVFFNAIEKIRSHRIRHIAVVALIVLMCMYGLRIIERNKEWKDPLLLYFRDSKNEPDSFILHCNLGVEYFRKGMMQEAKKEFLASNEVCPGRGYDVSYNNLGVVYAREGDISKAISCYKKSIELNNYVLAYANLGGLYNSLKMYDEAISVLEEGRRLYPLDVGIKDHLGTSYSLSGQPEKAEKI